MPDAKPRELWSSADYIRVALMGVEAQAHVGLHPWEKHPERPTRLIVDVEMFAHASPGVHANGHIIDYDPIRDFIKAWAQRPHTPHLETLAEDLAAQCFKQTRVEACRIGVYKPDIFNEVERAGIEIYRTRGGQT
jgi:dihydroneopterin aldolase